MTIALPVQCARGDTGEEAATNTGWSEGGERGRMCEHQPGHHCQCVSAGAEAALGDGEGALHKAAAWIAHGLQGDGQ